MSARSGGDAPLRKYAGVGWSSRGFQVAVIGDDPAGEVITASFPPAETSQLIAFLSWHKGGAQELACVVDSTNGLIGEPLLAAGFTVYRYDPGPLSELAADRSMDPYVLARCARTDSASLIRLDMAAGALRGRYRALVTHMARAQPREHELVRDGRLFWRLSAASSHVALTFDDGPCPPFTDAILDILSRYGARATFFCTGLQALGHANLIMRAVADGHTVGNHTWSHPFMVDLHAEDGLSFQINETERAIVAAAGRGSGLVRPAYGARTTAQLDWFANHGFRTVLWDVDSLDWSSPGTSGIVRNVLDHVRNGSIILMHDGGGDRSQTVEALPRIVEGLFERGLSTASLAHVLDVEKGCLP